MSVSITNLDIIKKYDKVYETSNETHVLGKDFEKILATAEYKILGFVGENMFCSSDGYIVRNTLDGVEIARVFLECDHAAFCDGLDYFYAWNGKTVTKIYSNLTIDWSIDFEDNISSLSL